MQKVAIISIIAFLYALTAQFSFSLAAPATIVSPVWPPAGIALASVLIFDDFVLLGIFIGCFIANSRMFLTTGLTFFSFSLMLVPAIGAVMQAYVGKLALIKFTGSYNIFQNTQSVLIFILVTAFSACLINASLSTSLLVLIGKIAPKDWFYQWLTWWIADAVGVVSMGSTIIAFTAYWKIKISRNDLVKLVITWIFILITGFITTHTTLELSYVYIPFAILAAFQADVRLSLITGLLIAAICLYDSINSNYHLHMLTSVNVSITLMQIFITIVYLTILLIHAILSEREKAYDNLQLLNIQLEKLVIDRTSDLFDSNKQLEVQKNKALEALESLKQSHARLMQSEKMASLGMLTAGVAHEIKHPLNATIANLTSIKVMIDKFTDYLSNLHLNEDIVNEIHSLQSNITELIAASYLGINRTTGVIADLSAFARSDEPEMIMIDLQKNIDSTLNLLSSEIKDHIAIIKDYKNIPPLLCHPGKINQVIMNILVNAIHALQSKQDSKIIIRTEFINDAIIITIKDNGPGIKKEVLEKLFIPFMTTKTGGMGSGLGLFISNNIIKEHHGKIQVTSELNKGTEFVITLPITEG